MAKLKEMDATVSELAVLYPPPKNRSSIPEEGPEECAHRCPSLEQQSAGQGMHVQHQEGQQPCLEVQAGIQHRPDHHRANRKEKKDKKPRAGGEDVFRLLQLFKVSSESQLHAKALSRQTAKEFLIKAMNDPSIPGLKKQEMRCDYVHAFGRALFSCPRCWLCPGLCVCNLLHRLAYRTKLVVSVHPSEWCKSSNSGTAAALSMGGSVLLRGLQAHDDELEAVLADDTTKAILWPGETAILPQELKAVADRESDGRVTLIAIDAHWNGARHLVGTFPSDMLRVKLPPENVLLAENGRSLLKPLRNYRGDVESNGRVSTLEAVAAMLFELEGDKTKHDLMLENLKIKVDAVLVQKLRKTAYGTIGAEQGLKAKQAAEDAGTAYIKELTAQGVDVNNLRRGLLKYLKSEDD